MTMRSGSEDGVFPGPGFIAPELAFLVHREMKELGIIPEECTENPHQPEQRLHPPPLLVVKAPADSPSGSYELRSSRSPKEEVAQESSSTSAGDVKSPPSRSRGSTWQEEFLSSFDKVSHPHTYCTFLIHLHRTPAGRLG